MSWRTIWLTSRCAPVAMSAMWAVVVMRWSGTKQDDMGDLAVVGVPDGEDSDQVGQALGRRSGALRLGRGDLDGEVEGRRRDLVQDLFLGAEVEVQRGGAQPGLGCDVPGGGGMETAFGERRGRGQQDAPGTGREVVLPEESLAPRPCRRRRQPRLPPWRQDPAPPAMLPRRSRLGFLSLANSIGFARLRVWPRGGSQRMVLIKRLVGAERSSVERWFP